MPSLFIRTTSPCPLTEIAARELSILLPGGVRIAPMMAGMYATELEMARSLLGGVHQALAPLKPFFDLLEAVMAIVKILETVPKVPTNPAKFLAAMKDAAKKFAALAKLVPQLTVPVLLGHALDVLIKILLGTQRELDLVVAQQFRINALTLKIVDSSDVLTDIIACANRLNRLRMCAIDESIGPLAGIIDLLNVFLSMLGLPKIAALGAFGHDPFKARTMLQEAINALKVLRRSLPVPPLVAALRC